MGDAAPPALSPFSNHFMARFSKKRMFIFYSAILAYLHIVRIELIYKIHTSTTFFSTSEIIFFDFILKYTCNMSDKDVYFKYVFLIM